MPIVTTTIPLTVDGPDFLPNTILGYSTHKCLVIKYL